MYDEMALLSSSLLLKHVFVGEDDGSDDGEDDGGADGASDGMVDKLIDGASDGMVDKLIDGATDAQNTTSVVVTALGVLVNNAEITTTAAMNMKETNAMNRLAFSSMYHAGTGSRSYTGSFGTSVASSSIKDRR
mmetsp:Transcript_16468/g.35638  ORF Transcript_16468/g.35638 Transcript_16468/m.35638 type:complete len:134 (-) Transcript_16468:661-1062(-)